MIRLNNEKQYYLLDNILSKSELFWIYHALLSSNSWNLARTSKDNLNSFNSWPGMIIQNNDQILNEFFAGYFRSIIFRIEDSLKKNNQFELPKKIIRIHIGAKSSFSQTKPHTDSDNENYWTILGFLNPIWNNNDGGQFYLDKNRIEYKPGRFIIFPSNIEHDGGFVKNEKLAYWRISSNIILSP